MEITQKRSVFVIDPSPVIHKGMDSLIKNEEDLEFAGSSRSLVQAKESLNIVRPDLVFLDVFEFPEGIDLLYCQPGCHFIGWWEQSTNPLIAKCFTSYANGKKAGFISKRDSAETILKAIRAVLKNEIFLDERTTQAIFKSCFIKNSQFHLTMRELQILIMLGKEVGTAKISRLLDITKKTVETHYERLRGKFGFDRILPLKNAATAEFELEESGALLA